MKNRVNLYHSEFHPKLRLLTLSIVIMSWLFVTLCCAALYFYESSKQQELKSEIAEIEQDRQRQKMLVDELQSAVDNKKIDPKLLEKIEMKQKFVSLKKRVLNKISGQEGLKSNGFSNLMIDLANHNQDGLWLTHISLNGMSVVMEGAAINSALVPKWLSSLGQTDYFRGQEFADTKLFRDVDQQLNFVISTGKELVDKSGATDE